MRTPSNRESQLTVQLTFKHADLTPFWYGWDGRAFLCFLERDDSDDTEYLYSLRHVYCGNVDIFGVLGEWAVSKIERACYMDREGVLKPEEGGWNAVAEGGL